MNIVFLKGRNQYINAIFLYIGVWSAATVAKSWEMEDMGLADLGNFLEQILTNFGRVSGSDMSGIWGSGGIGKRTWKTVYAPGTPYSGDF